MDLRDKNVLIVGLGKSGLSAARLLSAAGARLSMQDGKKREELNEVPFGRAYLGGELPPEDASYEFIVLSPGVPPSLPWLEAFKAKGSEILGELELAYRVGRGRYIGITGTNGKTTTTTLVGEISKRAGLPTIVEGNIGTPLCEAAEKSTDESCHVVEVSSFQLETIRKFRPSVSAILNITPDHLNRHGSMEGYIAAKARIFENQGEGDYIVYNADDPETARLMAGAQTRASLIPFSRKNELALGTFTREGIITIRNEAGEETTLCATEELKIPGAHNIENALAAAAICYFAGISPEVISEELREFPGVEHRIEPCGEIRGVRFFNDSKGTNPDASIKAIEAMKGATVIIAGGYDKGSDFDEFIEAFGDKVKYAVLLGTTAEKIKETAAKHGFGGIFIEKDMASCVRRAFELSEPGYSVLLSPACASWDMYPSYEVRGRDFKEEVRKLSNEG